MRALSKDETLGVSGGGNSRNIMGWSCGPVRQRRPRLRFCFPRRTYEERAQAKRARPA
jgi:hypothetical protein